MAFVSSPSSTNEVNTAYGVSTYNTQVSCASTKVSTASTQDLEQIHEDDLEEMDLKWQLALLSMRTRRGPRNQNSKNRNQDSSKRTINVEETFSKGIVVIDGAGFDWSYMADDEVPTNMALMAFSDSEFNKSEFNLATYERGLASVKEQLVFYKKNEVIFFEQIAVLKRDISYKDSEISMVKSELEKLKQEKENNQLKIEKFNNASKSLDKLIRSQITDKSRKGVGFISYNVVPPPHTGLFSPPNLDLSYSGLEEFQQSEFEGYGPKTSKSVSKEISNEVRESLDAPLVEELVSDDKLEKKIVFPTVSKIEFVRPKQQEKPVRKPVKYAEMYSFDHVQVDCNYHQRERVIFRNNYTMVNYNYSAKKAHLSAHSNMASRAVLMKTGLRPLNTARPVNTAHPKTTVYSARPMSRFSKSAQSTVKRPYQIRTSLTNKNFSQKVNTAKGKFYTARPKAVNTARPNLAVVNAVRENQLAGESQVLLKVPRKNNMYMFDMKNIVPKECLTCLVAKATLDESMLWHRRLGHGKQHKAILFTWVFFLATKNETSGILKIFITEVENLVDKKVKIIICDNGTEFKNRVMSEFCEKKGIEKEFSVARTPRQNGVAERRNRTLIEAARTMLADSKLPTTFWAEAVNTACCVQNRKDGSLFDYSSKNISNDGPQPSSDAGKKDDEGVSKESGIADQERHENSTQGVNTAGPSINAEPDMFSLGDNATLEATHADFFGDEIKVNMSNITTTYLVPSYSKYKNPKDHHLIMNKKDERSIVIRNKARLVTHGHSQEEGIDYDEVFAPIARIEAIRLFLAYASFMRFMVYQMDAKSAFLYGRIEEEQKEDEIFISQDKYVADISRKFSFTDARTSSTLMDTKKPLLKDLDGDVVDVHL
ncbi:putative ribonuclease H-like domain-containing protein [Tanacetum coccineum]